MAAAQVCAICDRTLLVGERTTRFSPEGVDFVDVCPLCQDIAAEQGWLKEGSPTTPTFDETTLTAGDLTLRPLTQSDADDVAEVGYWVAPWARGRGVAAQATRVLCEWAIRDHGFERVQLFAATGNAASQRVAEEAGFVREGVARNACCVPDGRADMVLFSLVPEDLKETGPGISAPAAGLHPEDSTSIAASSERSASPRHDIALVGIGADGWSGLTMPARAR